MHAQEKYKLSQEIENLTVELNEVKSIVEAKSKNVEDLQNELSAKEKLNCQEVKSLNVQLSEAETMIKDKNDNLESLQKELELEKEEYKKKEEQFDFEIKNMKEEHSNALSILSQEMDSAKNANQEKCNDLEVLKSIVFENEREHERKLKEVQDEYENKNSLMVSI